MKKLLLLIIFCCTAIALQAQTKTTGIVSLMTGMTAKLDLNNTNATATLTFTGPSDRWFALQFGSFATGGGMQDGQDVVYYNGTTLVDGVHNGVGATPSTDTNNWTVTSNTVAAGTRTIIATRPFTTGSADDYQFVYSETSIDFAYSRYGSAGYTLAYHGANRGYDLNNAFTCVAPAAPTASAQAFCPGATVSQLAATGVAGATFSWYAASTGGSALAGTTMLTTANYYVSQTLDGCESLRSPVAVTVTTVALPTASAQTHCIGATVANLTATGSAGATINWYANAAGGTALAGNTALATGNYYVSQTSGSCESARATVAVTVADPAAPAAASQTLCSGATVADLVATGTAGAMFHWYTAPAGGTALAGNTALATGNYYVAQMVGACESPRTMVAVTVNTVAMPTASGQAFCSGATVANLVATGSGGAIFNWYTAPTGGTALAAGTTLATGNYYVSQTVGTCESARTLVGVTVNTVSLPTAGAQSFCMAATASQLTATGSAGATFSWYNASTGGSPISGSTALSPGNYYVSQTVGACESARIMVPVSITIAPVPTAQPQALCEGSTIGDIAVGITVGATVNWYLAPTGGAPVGSGTLLSTGSYYVSQTTDACESSRVEVPVTLNAVPVAPTGEATQQYVAGETIASFEVITETGAITTWYMMNDAMELVVVPSDMVLEDGAVYYVTQTTNNCESDFLVITADEMLGSASFTMAKPVAYPNPASGVLTIKHSSVISSVVVLNLLGQEVLNQRVNSELVTIDTSKLAAGNYILKVSAADGITSSIRIVKE